MRIEEEGSERLPSEFAEIRAAGRLRDRLAGIKLGRGLGQTGIKLCCVMPNCLLLDIKQDAKSG